MRKGFTIIEIMVVISIISILFVTTLVRFGQIRITARDSTRKTGVRAIEQALESSHVALGTYLVTVQGQSCGASSGELPFAATRSGAGCTGASGLGMGLVNLASTASTVSVTTTVTPHMPFSFRYSSTSIAAALKQNGYLVANTKDPQSYSTSNPNSPDYALLSFNAITGSQVDGGDGAFIAVFTSLEGAPTLTDSTNTANYGGGANQLPNSQYVIDFAAPSGQFTKNLFSAGNGSPKSGQAQLKLGTVVVLQK